MKILNGVRQGLVLQTLLPNKEFSIDCASSPTDSQERDLQIFLDELARALYQCQKYFKKN